MRFGELEVLAVESGNHRCFGVPWYLGAMTLPPGTLMFSLTSRPGSGRLLVQFQLTIATILALLAIFAKMANAIFDLKQLRKTIGAHLGKSLPNIRDHSIRVTTK